MAKTNGKGSVTQLDKGKDGKKPRSKCRKWQLRVNCGLDPATGKYKVMTRRFSGTYTEATKALHEFVSEVEDDNVQPRTKYTVQQFCDRYVERRELNKEIQPTTAYRIKSNLKSACAHIGKANIASVTPSMLDDMYTAMLKGKTLSGKPSSGTHVHHIHTELSMVFKQAVKEGVLAANPCEGATPPRMDTKERRAVDPAKCKEFVSELDPSNDTDAAFMLAVCMGLRRGEVCGLSWGEVDFEGNVISVSHSVDAFSNLKGTKTKAGNRILPMPEVVSKGLATLKTAQTERIAALNRERKRGGHGIPQLVMSDESPVIATVSGDRLHPTTLSKWWKDSRGGYGLDGVTFHELRHTYLSMLAANGVHPKVMQELAGHTDPTITMGVYTHLNLDAKRKAVDVFSESLMSRSKEPDE